MIESYGGREGVEKKILACEKRIEALKKMKYKRNKSQMEKFYEEKKAQVESLQQVIMECNTLLNAIP